MKHIKFIFAFIFIVILSSCLDNEEKIILNADNSGRYTLSMDFSSMLKMVAAMELKDQDPEKQKTKMDTVIYLGNTNYLTDIEKALYNEASISIKLNAAESEMKMVMTCPFKNIGELTEIKRTIYTCLNKVNISLDKEHRKSTGEKEPAVEKKGDMDLLNTITGNFIFLADAGKISNTLNINSFKSSMTSPLDTTLASMKQTASLIGDFNYRTIIVLPAVVKKYNGPGSAVSADKKTVTFFTTFAEMLDHPEKVSYEVIF